MAETLAEIREVRSELESIKETEPHNNVLGKRLEAIENEREKIRKELAETEVAKSTLKIDLKKPVQRFVREQDYSKPCKCPRVGE